MSQPETLVAGLVAEDIPSGFPFVVHLSLRDQGDAPAELPLQLCAFALMQHFPAARFCFATADALFLIFGQLGDERAAIGTEAGAFAAAVASAHLSARTGRAVAFEAQIEVFADRPTVWRYLRLRQQQGYRTALRIAARGLVAHASREERTALEAALASGTEVALETVLRAQGAEELPIVQREGQLVVRQDDQQIVLSAQTVFGG